MKTLVIGSKTPKEFVTHLLGKWLESGDYDIVIKNRNHHGKSKIYRR